MASTRNALKQIQSHVDESMGVRTADRQARLSPVASAKDVGRKPLRKFGKLRLDQIIPDPKQPRVEFDDEHLSQLAASIQKTGQLHPIRVRWSEVHQKWIVITGERRYRATLTAGLSEIDCYFHDDEMTDSEILEQQLVENLLRQNLKPLEEARGYVALMELNSWTGKQVAEALRVSTSRVSRSLALLDLPEEIQQQVESGAIPRSTAYELSKLDNPEFQQEVAGQTHAKTKNAVRQRKGKKQSRGIKQVFVAENGLKVVVSSPRKGSYHEIEEALKTALEEVQHRINSNVQLF